MKEIVQEGAAVLREESEAGAERSFSVRRSLRALLAICQKRLMSYPEGVALAAPQIGVSYRLFIVRKDRTLPPRQRLRKAPNAPILKPEVEIYINPEVVKNVS